MKIIVRNLAIVGIASFALLACESGEDTKGATSSASLGAMNDSCPLSGEPVDPNAKTVSYKGTTVGFCCNACAGPWERKSDDEKAKYITSLKK